MIIDPTTKLARVWDLEDKCWKDVEPVDALEQFAAGTAAADEPVAGPSEAELAEAEAAKKAEEAKAQAEAEEAKKAEAAKAQADAEVAKKAAQGNTPPTAAKQDGAKKEGVPGGSSSAKK